MIQTVYKLEPNSIHNMQQSFKRKSETDFKMSQNCPTCDRVMTKPPSCEELKEKYPSIKPTYLTSRELLRCQRCDLLRANNLSIQAECPPPNFVNPTKRVERDIRDANEHIKNGVMVDGMRRILPNIWATWREMRVEQEVGIRNAWLEYWGIWGKLDGHGPKEL
ncbi:hypothetical protein PVAG01_03170 [Phlyctema vagabunda]|uniref:Uncharacterized protein n=1 Tax=Phlyctema vagabunda TaxID=108571 RepID=A0ABR4PSP8_9HELO